MRRMSAMQKMQAAMGGKPLGPNGQPSPAQIEAMRVSREAIRCFVQSSQMLMARKRCPQR
jgi:hypothetical protein